MVWSNPGITAEATHWLADRSRVHGVEGPSTDRPDHNLFPNHRVCRDRGITHYEWLCNLEELVGKGEFEFSGPSVAGQGRQRLAGAGRGHPRLSRNEPGRDRMRTCDVATGRWRDGG